jgi:hypothetical protein
VKAKVTKRVAVRIVKDIRRKSTRSPGDAKALLREVGDLFLDQANVDLTIVGEPEEMLVQKDLQNPVALDKELTDIVNATPPAAADLFVYCVWNVEDSRRPNQRAAGLTNGTRSFVDDGLTFGSDVATQLFGHELGHALGLPDVPAQGDRLMFRAKTGGLKLVREEIDAINPSGLPVR